VKPEQDFRDLLLKDNQLVRAAGLTHQKIAEPMLAGFEALYKALASGKKLQEGESIPFSYDGQEYSISPTHMGGHIKVLPIRTEEELAEYHKERLERLKKRPPGTAWLGAGVQGSVFHDELFEDSIFTIQRKKDGKNLQKDMLTPHLIYRYGFYQGGDYRVDPKEVADFFGLKGDQAKAWEEAGCVE